MIKSLLQPPLGLRPGTPVFFSHVLGAKEAPPHSVDLALSPLPRSFLCGSHSTQLGLDRRNPLLDDCIYGVVGYLLLGGALVGVVKLDFEGSARTFKRVIDGGVGLCCFAASSLLARCVGRVRFGPSG